VPAGQTPHPIRRLVVQRILLGILTLFLVSIVVFAATQLLPGNAAYAVLGQTATPAQLRILEHQMGLDRPALDQYWSWLSGLLQGDLGRSLTARVPVSTLIWPRIVNSAALGATAGVIGTVLGVAMGLLAAIRRDKVIDHIFSVTTLG